MYFFPRIFPPGPGQVLRFTPSIAGDTFSAPGAWTSFNVTTTFPSVKGFAGSVFDGRYIYAAPFLHTLAVRYDTRAPFGVGASWQSFDIGFIDGRTRKDTQYVTFDGRYVWYHANIILSLNERTSTVIRFDTLAQTGFSSSQSWEAIVLAENGMPLSATDPQGIAGVGSDTIVAVFQNGTTRGITFAVWSNNASP
jgi:hypothetical protein